MRELIPGGEALVVAERGHAQRPHRVGEAQPVVGAVGASVGAPVVSSPTRYLGFLVLYDLLFGVVCWASFEYVVAE